MSNILWREIERKLTWLAHELEINDDGRMRLEQLMSFARACGVREGRREQLTKLSEYVETELEGIE